MPNTDHQDPQAGDPPDRSRDRQRVETSETAALVRAEIEALHAFFVAWFTGSVSNDDDTFQAGFARRFDPGFVMISPSGQTVPLAALTRMVRTTYGQSPGFGIEIRNVTLRRELGRELGQLCVVTYEEWQTKARRSTPPDNARISTVLLERDRVAPGGYAWLHLHECWLPPA